MFQVELCCPLPSKDFPCGSAGQESTCNVGDPGSITGLERSPGKGKGYTFQYSGLENSMDCIVHESQRVGHNWVTFMSPFQKIHWTPNSQYLKMWPYVERGFLDIIVKKKSFWRKVTPDPLWLVSLYEDGDVKTQGNTQGRYHLKMEAEIGVVLPQAKEQLGYKQLEEASTVPPQ